MIFENAEHEDIKITKQRKRSLLDGKLLTLKELSLRKPFALAREKARIILEVLKNPNKHTPCFNSGFLKKTRICRDNESIYENAPSREIKKWFESRRV